jgi:hypothetical protein
MVKAALHQLSSKMEDSMPFDSNHTFAQSAGEKRCSRSGDAHQDAPPPTSCDHSLNTLNVIGDAALFSAANQVIKGAAGSADTNQTLSRLTLHDEKNAEVSINKDSVQAVYTAPRYGKPGTTTELLIGGQHRFVKESPQEVANGVGGMKEFTVSTGDKLFVNPSRVDASREASRELGAAPDAKTELEVGKENFYVKETPGEVNERLQSR